jgi:hypothetical protein
MSLRRVAVSLWSMCDTHFKFPLTRYTSIESGNTDAIGKPTKSNSSCEHGQHYRGLSGAHEVGRFY